MRRRDATCKVVHFLSVANSYEANANKNFEFWNQYKLANHLLRTTAKQYSLPVANPTWIDIRPSSGYRFEC